VAGYSLDIATFLGAVRGYFDRGPLDVGERGLDALGQDEVIPLRAFLASLGANAVALDLRNVPIERADLMEFSVHGFRAATSSARVAPLAR
jgi:hypothetical protein